MYTLRNRQTGEIIGTIENLTDLLIEPRRIIGRPRITRERIPQAFLYALAHHNETPLNKAKLARECGISRPTVYKYLALLDAANQALTQPIHD